MDDPVSSRKPTTYKPKVMVRRGVTEALLSETAGTQKPLRSPAALKPLNSLDFRHKKRRPWTSLDVEVVEPGSFEQARNDLDFIGSFCAQGFQGYSRGYTVLSEVPKVVSHKS